jgi:hypothetical protein
MSKKLTLRLNEDVIERAKEYASHRGTSVSQLVEDYFTRLTERGLAEDNEDAFPERVPPLTRRLLDRHATSEADVEEYYEYLEEKYS